MEQKVQRIINGLSQMSPKSHPKLGELQDKLYSILNDIRGQKSVSTTDKEETKTLGSEISADLQVQSKNLPVHEEGYNDLVASIIKRVVFIKENVDFTQAFFTVKEGVELDDIIDQFFSIAVEAEQISESPFVKIPVFTFLSHQSEEILKIITEEIPVNKKDPSKGSNNSSRFILSALEMIESLPLKNRAKIEAGKEQVIMDNELICSYCEKINEVME